MIGDTIKKLRRIYGFSASEMSKNLEISPSYFSEIENNRKQPTLELLNRFSKIFDIRLSSLILLSENLDEEDGKKGNIIARNMMLHLIDDMSKKARESDEQITR